MGYARLESGQLGFELLNVERSWKASAQTPNVTFDRVPPFNIKGLRDVEVSTSTSNFLLG